MIIVYIKHLNNTSQIINIDSPLERAGRFLTHIANGLRSSLCIAGLTLLVCAVLTVDCKATLPTRPKRTVPWWLLLRFKTKQLNIGVQYIQTSSVTLLNIIHVYYYYDIHRHSKRRKYLDPSNRNKERQCPYVQWFTFYSTMLNEWKSFINHKESVCVYIYIYMYHTNQFEIINCFVLNVISD